MSTLTHPAPRAAAPDAVSHVRQQLPMLVLLFGTWLLRLADLGGRSLWTDEGTTWTAARAPIGELLRLCAVKDASPPLFYLLTHASLMLGESEAHLRFVSTLASVGLVWMTYRIARLAVPPLESLLAAAIIAVSPYQQLYGQEARTYALVSFLTVASLYLFLRAVILGRRRSWLPYVIVSTLAVYTQSIAVLGVGAQAMMVLLFPAARRKWVWWAACQTLVLVLYVPWLIISMQQMSHLGSSHWYIPLPNAEGTFKVLRNVFLSPVPLVTPVPGSTWPGLDAILPRLPAQALLILIPTVPLFWSLRSTLERSPRGFLARAGWVALLAPLAAVLLISFKTSLWLPRYFVFLSPFVALLTARGLMSMQPQALARAWTALVLVLGMYSCIRVQTDWDKEPWREVARHIAAQAPRGRIAVLVPFDVDPFRYYNMRLGEPVDVYAVSHELVPFADRYTSAQLDEMDQRSLERTRDYDQVWVVVRSANSPVRRVIALRSEGVAARDRVPGEHATWHAVGGPLRVSQFVKP